jgi:hypothetical protein
LAHAANDGFIVEWARTLRIDAPPSEALRNRLAAALAHDGVRLRVRGGAARTYALVEGPQGVDPAQVEQLVPDGTWYGEAIIALAIEPAPADALQTLARALCGPGAPAGVHACEIEGTRLLVEILPSVTHPALVLRIVDVELARFAGHRRTELLGPLSEEAAARIAASGLQAAEIGPDRILETLLERAHVE